MISAADTAFADLRVWQDIDGDGVTDAGELKTLDEAGIASISLTATPDGSGNALNVVARTGTFTRTDATTGTIGATRDACRRLHGGRGAMRPRMRRTRPQNARAVLAA